MFIAQPFIMVEMESWLIQGLTYKLYICMQPHTADKANKLELFESQKSNAE